MPRSSTWSRSTPVTTISAVATAEHWAERTPEGRVPGEAFKLFTGSGRVLRAAQDIQQALARAAGLVYKDLAEKSGQSCGSGSCVPRAAAVEWATRPCGTSSFSPKVDPAAVAHLELVHRAPAGPHAEHRVPPPSWWESAEVDRRDLVMLRALAVAHTIVDGTAGRSAEWCRVSGVVTDPEHTLLRLHGRNAQAYAMPARTAAERFDYAYTTGELAGPGPALCADGAVGQVRARGVQQLHGRQGAGQCKGLRAPLAGEGDGRRMRRQQLERA